MFCSKCGTQISSNDICCPKCGALNQNYIEPHGKDKKIQPNIKYLLTKDKAFLKKVVIGCVIAGVAIVAVGFSLFGMRMVTSLLPDKASYSARGLSGYIDNDANAIFILEDETLTLPGPAQKARTSPDQKKKLVLLDDKKLLLYSDNENGVEIDTDVETIQAINNDCVYYTVTVDESWRLFMYDFTKKEVTDIGFESGTLSFSLNKNTVVGMNKNDELSMFCRTNNKQEVLFSIDDDDDFDIICVADDGSNLFWSQKNGNTYSIYTMKNGAPERIGKISNPEKYYQVYGYYYDNDNSCILYSPRSTQMILYKNNVPNEIVLPGTKSYATMINENGDYVDSDDDVINNFYISIYKNTSDNQTALYKLSPDGSLEVVVENIRDDSFGVRNNQIVYINMDGDLCWKEIKNKGEGKVITTDVDRYFISPLGKYVYIVKSGGLYYWDTSDESYKLNLISSSFTNDDSVYVTNLDNVIYYTVDQQEIRDTRFTHGTLFRYEIGEPSATVTDRVMELELNDTKYYDAEHPIIRRYVSNEKNDYIVDFGTLSDGEYIILLSGIKY